ncbi:MAG: hypothetical protein JKY37_33055 [Nannocystaceae bacterium]|nr:hypothetical protein [Nannocystaceae bacterium]
MPQPSVIVFGRLVVGASAVALGCNSAPRPEEIPRYFDAASPVPSPEGGPSDTLLALSPSRNRNFAQEHVAHCPVHDGESVVGGLPTSSMLPFRLGDSYAVLTAHGGDMVAQGFSYLAYANPTTTASGGILSDTRDIRFDGHFVLGHEFGFADAARVEGELRPDRTDIYVLDYTRSPGWAFAQAAERSQGQPSEEEESEQSLFEPSILSLVSLARASDSRPRPAAWLCGGADSAFFDVGVHPDGSDLVAVAFRTVGEVLTLDKCRSTNSLLHERLPEPLLQYFESHLDPPREHGTRQPKEHANTRGKSRPPLPDAAVELVDDPTLASGDIALYQLSHEGVVLLRVVRMTGTDLQMPRADRQHNILSLHDFDADGKLDLFFSFDSASWGVIMDVVGAEAGRVCPPDPSVENPHLCEMHGLQETSLALDTRTHAAGTDLVFTTHLPIGEGRAPVPMLHRVRRSPKRWAVDTTVFPADGYYVSPHFVHRSPPGEGKSDRVVLSRVNFADRTSAPVFSDFDTAELTRCSGKATEGLFQDFALRPSGDAPVICRSFSVTQPAARWTAIHLPTSGTARIRRTHWGVCLPDCGAPAAEDRVDDVKISPAEPTVFVRADGEHGHVCVHFDAHSTEQIDIASNDFQRRYYSVKPPQ